MPQFTRTFEYRLPRFVTDFHVFVQPDGHTAVPSDGRCTDISEEGLGARLRMSLEVEAKVHLIFTAPGATASVRIPARVVSAADGSYGFEFLFANPKERNYVKDYISRLSSPGTR
jgi:hypothetical protein